MHATIWIFRQNGQSTAATNFDGSQRSSSSSSNLSIAKLRRRIRKCTLLKSMISPIKTIQTHSDEYGLQYTKLDPRMLDKLPDDFLPGILVQLHYSSE